MSSKKIECCTGYHLNCVYTFHFDIFPLSHSNCRFQWPRRLRRRSAAARLLRSWVRIPPGAWMCVSCDCCLLLGRGLCDELITRPEESYRVWCVVVCDLETSWMRRPWPALGRSATDRNRISFQLVAFQKHSLKNCACISCLCVPAKMFGQQECVKHAALQLCVWEDRKHSPCNYACEIHLSYIYSSYRAVNPLRFGYRNQYVHINP